MKRRRRRSRLRGRRLGRFRLLVATLIAAALVAIGADPALRHVAAARMLARFEAGTTVEGIDVRRARVAGLRAYRYAPSGEQRASPLLLLHGVHPEGIDEPRLVRFARVLAAEGFEVVTPELEALRSFRLHPRTAERIAAAARSLAGRSGAARVGVVGISFGGGLALVAAAREPTIGSVLAVGPHHDARRLARWWTGSSIEAPPPLSDAARRLPPSAERYGAQVLAHVYAESFFGRAGAAAGRGAIEALVEGDREALARWTAALPPQGRQALAALRSGAAPERLAQIARAHEAQLEAISPAGRLDRVRARVFLLHGRGDPLIPWVESAWIADELPPDRLGGFVRTPLLRHAEGRDVSLADQLEVVHLVAGALRALRR